MLAIAKDLLEQEAQEQEEERQRYMEEHCPAPTLPRTMQELQVLLLFCPAPLCGRGGGRVFLMCWGCVHVLCNVCVIGGV